MSAVTPQRLQELIMFLSSPVKSKRRDGFDELAKVTVYPDLVPQTDEFLSTIIPQILKHLDDVSDLVREKCVKCLHALLLQIGTKSLDNTLDTVLPSLFQRLENEQSEEALVALLTLLLYLVDLVSTETYPSTWDNYSHPTLKALCVTFKSQAPEAKLLSCKVLDSMCSKVEGYTLKEVTKPVIDAMIPNMKHRQKDIRKSTILALANLFIVAQYDDDVDTISALFEKLVDDRTAVVRSAVVIACKRILTKHISRHMFYYPLLLPIFAAAYVLVPVRKIEEYEEVKQPEPDKTALKAYDALMAIAKQHEEDKEKDYRDELQYIEPRHFDDERIIPIGLQHIVQDNFVRIMDHLLPMLCEWTEQTRNFGYHAIITMIHLSGEYSKRYVYQILDRLSLSIRDIRGDMQIAMRAAAVLSANIPGDDLITFLVPKMTNEGPREIIMLLQVCLVNAKFSDGGLATIMNGINEARCYESLSCINNLAQAVLAMIERSHDFREYNTFTILITILRICERGDALHYFNTCFGRPLSTVFAEQMQQLLTVADKGPKFLSQLLLTCPPESIEYNIRDVCDAICQSISNADQEGTTQIMQLIKTLCERGAIPGITEELLQLILSKIQWVVGKENEPPREHATYALAALMKCDAVNKEMCDQQIENIYPMVISALDDSWSDPVRVAAVELAHEFIAKCTVLDTKFDDFYKALRDRIDDHVLSVRVKAVDLIASYFLKCQSVEAIPSKFDDLLLFIDDESEEMRNAIGDFIIKLSAVENWKQNLCQCLEKIITGNTHEQATNLGKELLEKLK